MGNSPKKVLFLITKGNFGGAQRYVYDLAQSLPKDQFTPVVAFGASSQLKQKLESQNIRTIEIPSFQRDINPVLELKALKEVIDVIKREKPDVLHVNSSKAGGIGALAGRLCGVPNIIFTAHNWAWNEKRNFISKCLIILAHWFTILLSHHVIAVSEETARQGRKLPFSNRKITVIQNGISDIDFIEKSEAKNKVVSLVNQSSTILGIVGELHENKGIDIAIKAFDKLNDPKTELVLIGGGEEKEGLTKLANSLSSKSRIHFAGYVENASRYLKAFDVFLLPSRNEAFPYVLLEAGKAGLPVVATRVGGVPEIIVKNETGILIDKENPEQLSAAIKNLIQNQDKAISFGNTLKTRVSNLFSLTRMAQKTIDLYNEVT